MEKVEGYERARNAFKKFLLFFVAALASVLVPVLHFVLVPVFMVLSLVMAYQEFRLSHRLVFQDGLCAQCGNALKPHYLMGPDQRFRCDECGGQYFIAN